MFERVVVTGSIGYDHIMDMPGRFADHIMPDKIHMLNVSFIMKNFRKEFGGTGGNIAYSLSLLGVKTSLVGSVGKDFGPYRDHLEKLRGLDIRGIREYKRVSCAQGFVMADRDDNQIWGYFEGAMGLEDRLSLKKVLKTGDFLVVAPNNPVAMMKFVREAIELDVPYMFDPAFNIAHFSKGDLKLAVEQSTILIGNDYEMELIGRSIKNKALRRKQNQIVVTTLGAKGSVIETGSKKIVIKAVKVKKAVDPTGAGDAYRAGFLAGYVRGGVLEVCGRMGAVAGACAVEKYGTQVHTYSVEEFERRLGESN